ncbi:MAG: 7-cyano-7-deazaguanine synthase QueC [Omnitrophica bacterium RIFCSPHIGHO2_02_FULL_46_11]|nr:MAG: 7-cyano-7-deazaguanine synthase QueC [Omnitrophica bacterium RIFCSPHIGHO2_02_FULL_46_11]OGW86656.1 MAG: 7-cyano-7-deazaguanine synthase QueC [Omnitrophica bacterium RIFCSPLOWO2_01_FULL_45_10b]
MGTLNKKAVCLLSGGLDSATVLYLAIEEGFIPLALTIDYGQLHRRELESAARIARHLKIDHQMISIHLPWGGSALLDSHIPMPENRNVENIPAEIPATYVPARNTIFLSLAASFAETRGAEAIFIGANALDFSGYPDCRPDYFSSFQNSLKLGTKCGGEGKTIHIKTPLISLKKSEIIERAFALGVPLELTWSCYKGGEFPCGLCDSCLLREKGFKEAGAADPLSAHSKTWDLF